MSQTLAITLTSWNCAGALRRKWPRLQALGADIIAVQECEDPARSGDAAYRDWAGQSYRWCGATKDKGLGLFARGPGAAALPLNWPGPAQYLLAAEIGGVPICAVWAHRGAVGRPYIGQLHLALQSPPDWLNHPQAVLLGDFNTNAIWDRPRRAWGHGPTLAQLTARGMASAYHQHRGVAHGAEAHPSFFLHRSRDKPYHLDYLYAGRGWAVEDCQIGAPQDWLAHSDHMPLTVRLRPLDCQDRPDRPARR
jgi:endonuclease/exonuclease/phosphatase family metal-dependent hydrolase